MSNKYHYRFINNAFMDFFNVTVNIFKSLDDRIKYTTINTYDKAVEKIRGIGQYDDNRPADPREPDKPYLPALILDPSGEMSISEANSGARQPYRFINLSPGFAGRWMDPIYQDKDVKINVGVSRVSGDIKLTVLVNSIYEYLDYKFLFLQFFGGVDRVIYPEYVNTFIIIPDPFKDYVYFNPYTGESHSLNLDAAGAVNKLVRSTNRQEYVFPFVTKPWYILNGISDGSQRLGGTDNIAEYKLILDIKYEIEIPAFLILETDYLVDNIQTSITLSYVYSNNSIYNKLSSLLTQEEYSQFMNEVISLYGRNFTMDQLISMFDFDILRNMPIFKGKTDEQIRNLLFLLLSDYLNDIPPEVLQQLLSGIKKDINIYDLMRELGKYLAPDTMTVLSKNFGIVFGGDTITDPITGELINVGGTYNGVGYPFIETKSMCTSYDLVLRRRLFHVVTQDNIDAIDTFTINVNEVLHEDRLMVITKDGVIYYSKHFIFTNDGMGVIISKDSVTVRLNDLIEIFIYDYD